MEYVPIDTDSIAIGPATISLKGKKGLFKKIGRASCRERV